jgi:hypothetical protein
MITRIPASDKVTPGPCRYVAWCDLVTSQVHYPRLRPRARTNTPDGALAGGPQGVGLAVEAGAPAVPGVPLGSAVGVSAQLAWAVDSASAIFTSGLSACASA